MMMMISITIHYRDNRAPKSQLSWVNLPHSPTLPPPVTIHSGQIPGLSARARDRWLWTERL